MAEPAIKKLGGFLADLTHDKPPDQIHEEILERLRDPDRDLDHRLAGVYLHVKDFVPIWTAIRNGVSLPASSWETVVLPVVVHFSLPQNLKPHLEAATTLFLNARGGREIGADPVPAAVGDPQPLSLLDSAFGSETGGSETGGSETGGVETGAEAPTPAGSAAALAAPALAAPASGRRWVPQAAAVAIVAVAAVALWTGGTGAGTGGNSFAALPRRPSVTVPPAEPSASSSPGPQTSGSPAPEPAATGQGAPPGRQPGQPPHIPGAPTGLTKTAVTRDSVTLTWRPPADAGNAAYYKVFKDGVAYPPTTNTTDTAIMLRPATAYTFVVRAYNSAGQESPPSNSIIVTTNGSMQTTFDVPSSVTFGLSFSVGGTGWPCSDVQILIDGSTVEIGKVDQYGSFDAQIKVHEQDGEPGWVDLLGSGDRMRLIPGKWTMAASCPGGPSLSASIFVTDDPMAYPSSPTGSAQR